MLVPLPALLGGAFLISELILARRWRSVGASNDKDRGTLRLLWVVILVATAGGMSAAFWGPRLPAGVPWPLLGALLFGLGSALRWWAISHLGRFFTVNVAVATDHRVVNDGPYRWVRHPSYSGLLLQFTGLALTMGALVTVVVMLVPISMMLWRRIMVEEAALVEGLGEPYKAYMRHTKRLVPGVL